MKKHLLLPIIIAVGCWGFSTLGGELAGEVRKFSAAPVLDGKLDDPCWKNALTFDKFYLDSSYEQGLPTSAMIGYDDRAVYVGFRCHLPGDGKLQSKARSKDDLVWQDDSVEVMLDCNGTRDRYFHFLVNSNGVLADRKCIENGHVGLLKWDSSFSAKTFRGKDFWSCEIKIPLYSLEFADKASEVWGINLARKQLEPQQEMSVVPGGIFHNAGAFLRVGNWKIDYNKYLAAIAPLTTAVRRLPDDSLHLDVFTEVQMSSSTTELKRNLELTLWNDSGAAVVKVLPLEPGKKVFKDIELPESGRYSYNLNVRNAVTRELYKRQRGTLDLQPSAFEIRLLEPAYRHTIYSSMDLQQVVLDCRINLSAAELAAAAVTVGIRRKDNAQILLAQKLERSGRVTFPAAGLPETAMEIFIDGGKLGKSVAPLNKLPFRKGEIWCDKDGYWRCEKQRFLPILEWAGMFSTPGTSASMWFADPTKNVRRIYGTTQWGSFTSRIDLQRSNLSEKDKALVREAVQNDMLDSNIFGYMIADEPEGRGRLPGALADIADIMRQLDPYHPVMISNNTAEGIVNYAACAEMNFTNSFPSPDKNKPRNNFQRTVVRLRDALKFAASQPQKTRQSIALCAQGFNYAYLGAQNTRVPNYDEYRTQYILSLAMGCNWMFFYIEGKAKQYPDITVSFPELAKEFRLLEKALVADDLSQDRFKVSEPAVAARAKKLNGDYYIIAGSTVEEPLQCRFELPELKDRKLYVMRENRTVKVKNGVFVEKMSNFDSVIYTTNKQIASCLRTNSEVEKEIEQLYKQRRKPGNLAWQKFEHDLLKLSASSNKFDRRRPDTQLWHVTDGVTDGDPDYFYWADKTPGVFPDWLALEFPAPVKVARAVVYSDGSLRSGKFQCETSGQWQTLAEFKNNTSAAPLTFSFAPVDSKKFRVLITEGNKSECRIHEIELYQK